MDVTNLSVDVPTSYAYNFITEKLGFSPLSSVERRVPGSQEARFDQAPTTNRTKQAQSPGGSRQVLQAEEGQRSQGSQRFQDKRRSKEVQNAAGSNQSHGVRRRTVSTHSWPLSNLRTDPDRKIETRSTVLPSPSGDWQDSDHWSPLSEAPSISGIFNNAHGFIIERPSFNLGIPVEEWRAQEDRRAEILFSERRRIIEELRQDGEAKEASLVLERLAAHGMPGAMLDAKEREFAPRCNEDTRLTLRGEIMRWGLASAKAQGLLWLSGPAAVGKSAVAQTVAEELKAQDLLGAVYFFSKPNSRSDPDTVIPTIVYQLALVLPEYRRLVTRRLIEDPIILDRTRRSQFEELISGPCTFLSSGKRLVIILDGLDECASREAQCEFVKLISNHVRTYGGGLRLSWMICSRPEPDLKVAFSTEGCQAVCIHKQLDIDNSEAQRDARRILKKGFAEIREQYPDQVGQNWPNDYDTQVLADRASGHLGFVSFLLRFIGDTYYANPSGQLDICVRFLKHINSQQKLNPLHALDLLCSRILSDIPLDKLPTARRILGISIFYGSTSLTAVLQANFLEIDRPSFYSSLQRLHSVLLVPPVPEAAEKSIHIYHASFSDYLKDPSRSQGFALDEGSVHLDVAVQGLRWLRYGRRNIMELPSSRFSWLPPTVSTRIMLGTLLEYSFIPCWKASIQVPQDSLPTLLDQLRYFNFDLAYTVENWIGETEHFSYFVCWLASLGPELKTPFSPGHAKGIYESSSNPGMQHIEVAHRIRERDDLRAFTQIFSGGKWRQKVSHVNSPKFAYASGH
ncbi:hypothetical protein NP233_g12805 [Leucocoprinus birnbaumii]|uniref:Nephrocystin 3-like N-terminal domain-containing protein n=1 Tax=Leucocoprinus birnbaumii TaxID=56174 RepID=A0AAD5YPP3_9AGAR|nr:hypothetical protein NP233_g12805 [Leucocoprinus birnbaumii]